MNSKQRPAIFIATVLVALLILFHAPWGGYYTIDFTCTPRIPSVQEIEQGKKTGFIPEKIYEGCDLPASEWRTWEPISKWFGSPWNILGSTFLIICVTGVWCYLYRTVPSRDKQP